MSRSQPRTPPAPLSNSDLSEFLSQSSDFALEMATLNELRALGLSCEHAATYIDPITKKIRAYDIRGRWTGPNRVIRFAVECKNLRRAAPLLVHATPRAQAEAYHTVIARQRTGMSQVPSRRSNIYRVGEAVGRQTDQPTRDDRGDFKSSDTSTFDKWLQAVNGCSDLLKETANAPLLASEVCAIVPILVVPTDTLWQVDYHEDGSIAQPVRLVNKSTLILRSEWSVHLGLHWLTYDISHLEIITLAALHQRVKNLVGALLADTDAPLTRS